MKTTASNDLLEVITDLPRYNTDRTRIFQKQALDPRGIMASDLIARWGMVSCRVDKEDAAASKDGFVLLSEAEVVNRACEMTELAYQAFQERGWSLAVPLPSDEDEDE